MNIQYTVNLFKPYAHIFRVTLKINSPNKNGQKLSMPAWIPGSYMIRDFAKNIISINAVSNNKPVKIKKLDKSSWLIENVTDSLIIEYEVYAWDLSVRTAHFDMTHAFYNGSSLFLMPQGFENDPLSVNILPMHDLEYQEWHVTTSLKSNDINSSGFGYYIAENYDDLIDHPVEIGTHTEFDFLVNNKKHLMTLTGQHRADEKRLIKDLSKICQTHCDMFGGSPKLQNYIFLVMVSGDGYGGLEHRSSTSLMCSRDDLPLKVQPNDPDEHYRKFLGLCSHEYFHLWNIKRIKPEAFLPYNLSNESYTQQLWAFEGITSYYDELALIRSGVISLNSYLELIGQTITRVLRGKGRFKQTIAESSFDAWTKFYKQDESAPNTIVSYYTKGSLLALCLDLTIRLQSKGNKSLDDIMRFLWNNYGKTSTGVPEGRIEEIATEISGINLNDFFQKYLHGVEELPLSELLSNVGISFNLRATTSVDDLGGKDKDKEGNSKQISFGARFTDNKIGARLTHVFSDESAEQAGLSAGDVIISINMLQVNKSNIEKVIDSYTTNDKLVIHAFRGDELKIFTLKLKLAELTTCFLRVSGDADETQISEQKKWLFL